MALQVQLNCFTRSDNSKVLKYLLKIAYMTKPWLFFVPYNVRKLCVERSFSMFLFDSMKGKLTLGVLSHSFAADFRRLLIPLRTFTLRLFVGS